MTDDSGTDAGVRLDPEQVRERARDEPASLDPSAPAQAVEATPSGAGAVGEALVALAGEGERFEAALSAVVALLDHDDAAVRAAAALALRDCFEAEPAAGVDAVDALVPLLTDDYPIARKQAAAALRFVAREHPPAAVAAVEGLPGLLDPDRPALLAVGLDLIDVAAEADPDAAVDLLGPLLDALAGMTDLGVETDPGTVDGVPRGAFDEREQFARASHAQRNRAARTVRDLIAARPAAASPVLDALLGALRDVEAGAVRASLAEAVGHAAGEAPDAVAGAIEPLAALLDDDDPGVVASAAWALGVVAAAEGERVAAVAADRVDALADLLDAPQPGARIAAAGLLAYVGEHRPGAAAAATEALEARLGDDEARVRASAALALGHAGAGAALASLRERADDDPDEEVRATARDAVARIERDG